MKRQFNLGDHLRLKKVLGLHNMLIVDKSVFHEDNEYYEQIFLDECLYKL